MAQGACITGESGGERACEPAMSAGMTTGAHQVDCHHWQVQVNTVEAPVEVWTLMEAVPEPPGPSNA
jgi:hypothetical protein